MSEPTTWTPRDRIGTETEISGRRAEQQRKHDDRAEERLRRLYGRISIMPIVAPSWLLPLPTAGLIALGVFHAGTAVLALASAFDLPGAHRELRRRVYVMSRSGNDPTDAIPALDDLVASLRNPAVPRPRLLASYENAVDRMQGLIPDHPLSQLEAYGYHPSRPKVYETNDRYRIVDHDSSPDTDPGHWERAMQAIERLRALLRSDDVITVDQVVSTVSTVVPPLRAVLRARRIPTWRIERLQPPIPAMRTDEEDRPVAGVPSRPQTRLGDPVSDAAPPQADAMTPIEDRLNMAASMTAMSLRSMMTAFRSANPSLFMGDDRQAAETLLDDHLPRTIAVFVTADDASVGAEKDEVRADFARSLAFIRDSLSGIMDRHRLAARQTFETQARFVEMKHGPNEITG